VSEEEISPARALWELEAPKLGVVDEVGFVVQLKIDKDKQSNERVSDPAAFLHYKIAGPIGNDTPTYLWLGTSAEEFMTDPVADAPPELTALAERAFQMWLAWTHEHEG